MTAVRFWHSALLEEFWRRFLQVDRSSGGVACVVVVSLLPAV
jgi:hypothetical protein